MLRVILSLFGSYSFYFFLTRFKDVTSIPWYAPLLLSGFFYFLLTKFSKGKGIHFLLSMSTAIPLSYFLAYFIPEGVKLSFDAGFYHFTKIDVTTILLSLIIYILPFFKNRWIKVVLKNMLLATSIPILIVGLCIKYVSYEKGVALFWGIPVLLPIIYHYLIGNLQFLKSIFIGILSYLTTFLLAVYVLEVDDYFTLQLMTYLIPVSFLMTLLLGTKPYKKRRSASGSGAYYGGSSYHGTSSAHSYDGYSSNQNNESEDTSFTTTFYNDDDANDFFYGSASDDRGDDHSNWGMSQWAIDQRNDNEFYGQPDWYREKEIEEREFGLPWHARSDSDED